MQLPKALKDPVRPVTYWSYLYLLALVQLRLHDVFSAEKLFAFASVVGFAKYFASGFIPLFAVGVMPVNLRNILVFWKLRNPLPGCRAFSVWMNRDARINGQNPLRLIGGAIPSSPDEENSKWYGLCKPMRMKPTVLKIHRKYLVGRDLTAQTWALTIALSGALIWEGRDAKSVGLFLVSSAVLLMIVSYSAQNNGERFVCTVLTEASH